MKKSALFILTLCLFAQTAMADVFPGKRLRLHESDGSPDAYFYDLTLSNGTLTDNGDGTGALSFFTLPSLTSGSVLFSNGTTIAQDNANFFWNDTDNALVLSGTSAATLTSATNKDFNISANGTGHLWLASNNFRLLTADFSGTVFEMDSNGRWGLNGTPSSAQSFLLLPDGATRIPLVVRGVAAQSASLQEWQNSSGTALMTVGPEAKVGIGVAPDTNSRLNIKNLAVNKDWIRFIATDGGLAAEFFENADNSAAIYLNDGGSTTTVLIDTTGPSYFKGGTVAVKSGSSTATAKIGGVLFDHFADAGNTGSGEDDLYSDTIAASTLGTNGDKLIAEYSGTAISGAGMVTFNLKAYFGGTAIFDSGAVSPTTDIDWNLQVTVIRESSTVVRCKAVFTLPQGETASIVKYTRITGLTLSNTNILKLTAESSGGAIADNDIVAKFSTVAWQPAA